VKLHVDTKQEKPYNHIHIHHMSEISAPEIICRFFMIWHILVILLWFLVVVLNTQIFIFFHSQL